MHVGLEFFPEINAHLISFSFFLVHAAAAGFIRTSSKAFSTSFSKNSLMIMEPSLLSDVQFQCHFALFRNGAKFLAIIRTLKWMIFYLLNQLSLTSTLSTVPISNINSHQIWHFNDGHAITKLAIFSKILIINRILFTYYSIIWDVQGRNPNHCPSNSTNNFRIHYCWCNLLKISF